nr:putative glycolipid-binding domain-containing protein [Pedobacter sp. ASV19]
MKGSIKSSVFTQVRIWKGNHSLEVFTLEQSDSGFIGGGIVTSEDYKVRYQVITDAFWRVCEIRIEDIDRPWLKLYFTRTEDDLWYDAESVLVPELSGCQEVDISITPFTNTLALKKLSNDRPNKFKVAYIRIPEFSYSAVEQVYQALGSGRYRYENLDTRFSAELIADEFGLVSVYPGLFITLPRQPFK